MLNNTFGRKKDTVRPNLTEKIQIKELIPSVMSNNSVEYEIQS